MTETEWMKKERALRSLITRKRNCAKQVCTFADKISMLEDVRLLEAKLRKHRLSRFTQCA